jgi:hypothetical protein
MKKIIPTFKGYVKEGKFNFYDEEFFNQYVLSMKDGDVLLSVRREGKNRSDNQNRYYWAVVIRLIAQELGYEGKSDLERLHVWIQEQVDHVTIMHDGAKIASGTSSLSTVEMEDYLSKVRSWASSFLNIYVPLPNETDCF